jgi:acyl carrier protein
MDGMQARGNADDVAGRVSAFIERELLPDRSMRLTEGVSLLSTLDSVGFMELLSFLEDEFAIEVDHGDIDEGNFGSVRTIAELVRRKVGG